MRFPFVLVAVAALLAATGCGSSDDSTPVACLEGAPTYLRALKAAPGEVELGGATPISDCLPQGQEAGDLANVGLALLSATTKLNAEARAEPGGAANLRLGYLLGAVERGSEATEGIHDELIRRLTAAARYSPDNRPLPATFLATYRRGYDAGQARG